MQFVTAEQAIGDFALLLRQLEDGREKITILRDGRPVAVLAPVSPPLTETERQKLVGEALRLVDEPLPWEDTHEPFVMPSRDEMHER